MSALLDISESATLVLWGVALLTACILLKHPRRADTQVHVGNVEARSLNS